MRVGRRRRSVVLFGLLFIPCAAALTWSLCSPKPGRAESAAIDPAAVTAWTAAAAYLRGLPAFSVDAAVTYDEVVHGDFNVQRASQLHVSVRRPDRMRAEVSGDAGKRLFVYNGSTLSIYLEDEHYYTTTAAPATLRELLDVALRQHAVELPLSDLLYVAMGGDLQQNVREAAVIGPSVVGGTPCLQLAFRGPNIDWQLWVEQGDRPLPRKLAITTTQLPTRPQYSAVLSWDTSAAVSDALFQFTPPPGAAPIRLGSVAQ